ncbi:putative CoA-transferase [Arthrobacter globiformis NBRC 12137]|uniref:Putative CoA-transferase n=1 Tax=Arthrobacter globiformis (strain ATCC 8010 / DSM 20124 / JCM 1332 / NBRC 12137 / NCIMB 8907 / NRRL B-2979 / 168) TaxID=1077972 RepID=H0QK32_ARTG1|nr:CoA transferase [Arthrobacter globiformis]GAB13272.1 putative CoA-transferase [Arthrobacter globiformis NBRC 12137]
MTETPRLLEGIRVLSLEQYIAGPYCTSILADAGAEVIKIERPGTGDPRRSYEPRKGTDDDYISGGFASYNRSKKSITLNLENPEDKEQFSVLLKTADVLVSNLRPGALARQGFGTAELRAQYPRLVICEITGFGASGGPYAKWPAFDSVIQAMSGLSSLIGPSADAPPGLAPMSTMDLLAGIWGALGILAGLTGRATTGQGCHVDTAMYDVGAALLERPLTLHEFTGAVPTRGADEFSPVGAFRAADGGWISIVIPTDDMWIRCCTAMERPELANDPELDTVLKRAKNMKTLIVPALEAWAAAGNLTREEATARLRETGQPAGAVQTIEDVRNCPQLAHRNLFTPLQDHRAAHHDGAPLLLPRSPLVFDGKSARPGPVPDLGQHNEELLRPLVRGALT